jgi:hypothetical protein
MRTIVIEQAIYDCDGKGEHRFLARSPGFQDEWLPNAQRLCTLFGDKPPGITCPECIFAQPLGKRHVAVVQVRSRLPGDSGRSDSLEFHLLVLSQAAYRILGGDPFLLAQRCPPPWQQRGDLPTLPWPALPPPGRTVEQVQEVLKREQEGPNLLGGSQALVDGGRLVFERPEPDVEVLRRLWMLLPLSTRCQLWPASFAFNNNLRFDAVVVSHASPTEYGGYLTEQQAGDYPEGRYELHLQIAAEAGNQRELDSLFARRSRSEVWRYGLLLLAVCLVLVTINNCLSIPPKPGPTRLLEKSRDTPTEREHGEP